jgi:hypothetical protein
MDATVIPLCIQMFNWASYRQSKGGIKLHTVLDYEGLLPVFCHLPKAKPMR